MKVVLAGVGLLGVTASVQAAPPDLPLYREFRDWQIACDNTGGCEARGFSRDNLDTVAVIRVTREAGPRGTLAVGIESDAAFGAADIRITGGSTKRGGSGVDPKLWVDASTGDQDHLLVLRDPAGAVAFLNGLRNADSLSLGKAGSVSLDGMTAALRPSRLSGPPARTTRSRTKRCPRLPSRRPSTCVAA